jgi:hypothetical protein
MEGTLSPLVSFEWSYLIAFSATTTDMRFRPTNRTLAAETAQTNGVFE